MGNKPKKIYIIAGEASGDLHGSNLIKNLRSLAAEPLEIYGVGGDKIRATGALEFFDLAHFHVTGFTDAFKRLPQYKKAGETILKKIKNVHPDLVVLIDNPGFNLHLAKKIHALHIPVVYYIAPQVWAWAPKRIFKIKQYVKKVLVVFEFEKKLYEENGIPVSWVGHPLKDLIEAEEAKNEAAPPKKGLLVSLLPGSRKGEIKMLLSIFLKAAEIIAREIPGASFQLIKSPTLSLDYYQRLLEPKNGAIKSAAASISIIQENPYGAIKASDLAIVCSGTATLECALLGTPMIISNRGSFITYLIAKSLAKVSCLGLPNLILGENKVPELLQYDATAEKIAGTAVRILKDPRVQESMRKDLKEVSRRLGEKGANQRAAREVLEILGGAPTKSAGIPEVRSL